MKQSKNAPVARFFLTELIVLLPVFRIEGSSKQTVTGSMFSPARILYCLNDNSLFLFPVFQKRSGQQGSRSVMSGMEVSANVPWIRRASHS